MRALMQLTVPGNELGGPRSLAAVPGHVPHLAVESGAQPIEKMRLIGRQIDVGHADSGEPKLRAPALDVETASVDRVESGARAHTQGYTSPPYNG